MDTETLLNSPVLPLMQEQDVLTVSELSLRLKRTLETTYNQIRVRGEISGFKQHSSGHGYFTLKDHEAVLDAVCWKGQLSRLSIRPTDGMEVICYGKITTYMGRSKYQLVVSSIELAGQGALLKILEDRKQAFYKEGLFAPERKKPLPFLPQTIGIITSPTGAVIRDILHRIKDRCPIHVLLWPVSVQGKEAEAQICTAIRGFNALEKTNQIPKPDILIVARGGGSLEDLWCFNEESVVRTTAESQIPIIAAVGHETDITLIDYAADRRAPTPTAAAEMAVPVRFELVSQIHDHYYRLQQAMLRYLAQHNQQLEHLNRRIPDLHALALAYHQRLDEWSERLHHANTTQINRFATELSLLYARLRHPREIVEQNILRLSHHGEYLMSHYKSLLEKHSHTLERWGLLLDSYSYTGTLRRGFSIVKDRNGQLVSHASQLKKNQEITLIFQDEQRDAQITS